MNYLEALNEFALEFKPLDEIEYSHHNIVFLGASSVLGFVAIILDIIAFKLKGKSFLDLKYNKETKFLQVILFWMIASTIVSYFGLIMKIFNSTIQSCVIVGFTWILLAAKIANKSVEPEIVQE